MTGNTKCINYACKGGTSMIEPPGFCLSFYRVKNKPNKKQQICTDYSENAVEHYDRLAEALSLKEPLLNVELPFRNDVVEIDDSDSDDEKIEDVHLDSDTVDMLEEHFDSAMSSVLNKYDFEDQIEKALVALNKKCDTINGKLILLYRIRSETDEMIFQLSDILRPDNVELLALDITHKKTSVVKNTPGRRQQNVSSTSPRIFPSTATKSAKSTSASPSPIHGKAQLSKASVMSARPPILSAKLVAPVPELPKMPTVTPISIPQPDNDSNLIVLQESDNDPMALDTHSIMTDDPDAPPHNLPPRGQLLKPSLVVGDTYYANRSEIIGAWVKVTLKEIIVPGTRRDGQIYTSTMYVVAIENKQKTVRQKIVTGREIAYSQAANVQLDVGARVIAVFREILSPEEARERIKKDVFYPGIVAEPLQSSNKYRYLIFFDDGYAQYVNFNLVHPIYEASKDVWEDVNVNSRSFIKKYLEKYPERPMVKLHKDQTIRTEYNGKWWVTTVMSVDCSLVQMFFDASGRVEWIYRGSTRLNPMFKEEQAASNRLQYRQRMTRKANTSAPYVEYTRPNSEQLEQPSPPQRSVARKSTSRPPSSNNNITYRVHQFLPTPAREAPATKIVDRKKCSCWQLTLQCLKYMDKDTDPDTVGYQYRRLPEPIFTGIYECNKKCKCAATCLNRVVQNPLHHKLQIFQTDMKGWGIRCLNDIPQGSFICIYAGVLLTEDMANRDGKFYGDEYLAELDFIETAERTKEDYEEDPYHDEVEKDLKTPERSPEESGPDDEDDDEEDDIITNTADDRDFIPANFLARKPQHEDSGIRTRLRKRQPEKVVVKQEKKILITAKPTDDNDTVMISDDEDYAPREPSSFNPKQDSSLGDGDERKYKSVRELFGTAEDVYIMDAKNTGNIGRFLNHSCSPNIFVQNVFVDTHDLRFPWVAFFTLSYVRAGTELTWNYNYDIGSVPDKELSCYCGSSECKGRLL
ncbi:histone-lysine n-methyltransferase eggless [Holotrichia oblita]|uniref:Histone-lysine n-methyltransferase eggless n=1 Tax=Holotrichia oblita TaxID=644536 RepID=A0ACB9SNK4_HOLOL|nr:histone-lysine n-methyltransferase eggless [Holotrichia oblita]